MNWQREGYDVMVSDAGYYVVRHNTAHGHWYNAWKGDHKDRDLREYVSAGPDRDAVFAACEEHAKANPACCVRGTRRSR